MNFGKDRPLKSIKKKLPKAGEAKRVESYFSIRTSGRLNVRSRNWAIKIKPRKIPEISLFFFFKEENIFYVRQSLYSRFFDSLAHWISLLALIKVNYRHCFLLFSVRRVFTDYALSSSRPFAFHSFRLHFVYMRLSFLARGSKKEKKRFTSGGNGERPRKPFSFYCA